MGRCGGEDYPPPNCQAQNFLWGIRIYNITIYVKHNRYIIFCRERDHIATHDVTTHIFALDISYPMHHTRFHMKFHCPSYLPLPIDERILRLKRKIAILEKKLDSNLFFRVDMNDSYMSKNDMKALFTTSP